MARLPLLALLLALPASAAGPGEVDLPLTNWETILNQLADADEAPPPPVPVLAVDRALLGSFERGVFSGTLSYTVVVLDPDQRVPVLGADTSISGVSLDGSPTSLLEEGGMYTVAAGPGPHLIRVNFFSGRDDDRFARNLAISLPPGGPTSLSIRVPEADIVPALEHGAIATTTPEGAATRVLGQVDASGQVALSWKAARAQDVAAARLSAQVHTLLSLDEALVRGLTVLDLTVLEGETDRVVLSLPPGAEVVDVTGDAVLQWQPLGDQKISVLLRYLVSDQTRVELHTQLPIDASAAVKLGSPTPVIDGPFEGQIGLQGPTGLSVTVSQLDGVEALATRDLPPELTELSPNPLLAGYRFEGAQPDGASPGLSLTLARQEEVEMTSTLVDEIQASTLLIEDGTEISKVRLMVRNNARQYLQARLPAGAALSAARIDGRPVRPALAPGSDGETLLLPLMQSERLVDASEQVHWVRDGENLSTVAQMYYGDASQWRLLLDSNRDTLSSPDDLEVGQALRVPSRANALVEERSFILELAWTREGPPMGVIGRRALALPELDVDAVAVHWHVFVPDAFTPLDFSGNLTQQSQIRYDPARRLLLFLKDALRVRSAWAGEAGYSSILSRRKAIFREETGRWQATEEVTSSFPLVGQRVRFSRILLGRDVPRLAVLWLDRRALPPLRLAGFAAAAWLTVLGLGRRRKGAMLAGFALLLAAAWFVPGLNRRLLWGLDAGLLWLLGRDGLGAALAAIRSHGHSARAMAELLSWKNLFILGILLLPLLTLTFLPLLWSTALLAALTWRWSNR